MRGGLERWKRGTGSQGVKQAIAYAFDGVCDSHLHTSSGSDALTTYSDADTGVQRFVVEDGAIVVDELDAARLARWVDGADPRTGERRGREISSPDADLVLDGTINAPKSYSLAALINDDLAMEFEALQDRLRDRVITTWQRELNARRGAGGRTRERVRRLEVVELQHRRSRALDPHIHRHLWLNARVQGEDERWSNVDSRVAMRLHTVINAEGELAARTDPQWVAALARNGYTLNDQGEVAELAAAVRPLSRRANQIESNKAVKRGEWDARHPGQHPGRDVLQQIDRWAWARGRPNKPDDVDEATWGQMVRDEIADIDPTLLSVRGPVEPHPVTIGSLDRNVLAATAAVEADSRSASHGGRFSVFDLRAGTMRALARSGVVADRVLLQEIIDDVVARGIEHTIDMLDREEDVPAHIKRFMSVTTATLKTDLATRFDHLNEPSVTVPTEDVTALAREVLPAGKTLDEGQTAAAGAIAGTDRLVTVTGPAGTGKTTMLRVAKRALDGQRRQLIVVAPTKKAASVARREVGAAASSLHALLMDHGWRWHNDSSGAQIWRHLKAGDVDPLTGHTYPGPRRYPLGRGDRVVVDEAGMVDLHTANALAHVAEETGCGIAMVGDHLQALPVGHSGAMGTMARRSGTVVELTAVHRFRDPKYAALSLRLREPKNMAAAVDVAKTLHARGQITRTDSAEESREYMVEAYFRHTDKGERVGLITSTNAEAQTINEAIQERRIGTGQLALARVTVGQEQQRILEGDTVQTRRNDRDRNIENRAIWTIGCIRANGSVRLVSVTDPADTRDVTADYVANHVHLAYATTVHGIQGETTDAAIVGPNVDASGLYVGMTRGRSWNETVAIARTDAATIEEIAATMLRSTPEVTLDDSTRAARTELGRAARTRTARHAHGQWDDQLRRRLAPIQERLVHTLDQIARDQFTLANLEARIRKIEAKNHAAGRRSSDAGTRERAAHRHLSERIDAAHAQRNELAQQYDRLTRVVDSLSAERTSQVTQLMSTR